MFLLASLVTILNSWDIYKNNRKIEAVMLFIAAIFIGLVAISMLLF